VTVHTNRSQPVVGRVHFVLKLLIISSERREELAEIKLFNVFLLVRLAILCG